MQLSKHLAAADICIISWVCTVGFLLRPRRGLDVARGIIAGRCVSNLVGGGGGRGGGEGRERGREKEAEEHEKKEETMVKGMVEAIVKFDRSDRKRAELDALSDPLRPVFTREKWIHGVREHRPCATLLMRVRFEFQIHYLRRRRRLDRFTKIKHLYWIFLSSFFPLLFSVTSFSGERIDRSTVIRRIMIDTDRITVIIIERFIIREESNFRSIYDAVYCKTAKCYRR